MNKDYIYKRRLLKLAEYLGKLPKSKFDFSKWVGEDWKGKQNLSCGTTACSLGHAATIPSLRKAGLRLYYDITTVRDNDFLIHRVGLKNESYHSCNPFNAAREVFDLSYGEFCELFTMDDDRNGFNEYTTPKEAANHIREFVKNKYES